MAIPEWERRGRETGTFSGKNGTTEAANTRVNPAPPASIGLIRRRNAAQPMVHFIEANATFSRLSMLNFG
jgi:hypothetical protein